MRKLQENEMENLNGGEISCLNAVIIGAAIGAGFGGIGIFVGALTATFSPSCIS
ncbi:hypothetical protein [Olivibacter sitiensis]|uniref:hypothetical protein n=1 Tax=Olivibacter sitiensis TaxID=376470 RepID=UPI000427CD39|nr:hypothetical protein [Olivibacter sitiensis]